MNLKMNNSTCRICLSGTNASISIFQVHIADMKFSEMLTSCSGVPVLEEDDFPKQICQSCTSELPNVWKFVKMCRSSDEMLRENRRNIINDFKFEIKEEYNPPSIKSDLVSDSEDLKSVRSELDDKNLRKMCQTNKLKKSNEPEIHACLLCLHIFKTVHHLNRHVGRHHPESVTHPCGACGKTFKRKTDLAVHSRTHTGERPFACALCPRRFSQSGTLAEHSRRHTGERPFVCSQCPRSFSSRSSFWRHRRAHSGEKPFTCERCGDTFAHSATLKHHALIHSADRPHHCSSCTHSAKSVYALRQHMLTHGEKHFICEHCGKKFGVKSNLVTHTRKMHSALAGHCVVCRKDTSDLHTHSQQHLGLTFICPVCSRSFRHKNGLSFHIALHTNACKYKCSAEGCTKAFPKQNMLDFHTRKVHSNEITHVCPYCSKGFYRTSDLSRHLNLLHSELNFFK